MNSFEKIIEKHRKYYNVIRILNIVIGGIAFVIALIALIISLVK
ncbi:MAG: hypothetical protein WCJ72_11195 [Chryseobacterium sp.]